MAKRRNALLAQPPEGIHKLTGTGGDYFRRQVGRPTTAEDYYGVHTTGSKQIAGVYAMGAVQAAQEAGAAAYPVILTLDVSGLRAVPDVDAIVRAAVMLDDGSLRESFEGMDLYEAGDHWESEYYFRPGSPVADAIMEVTQYAQGPSAAFLDEEDWQRWLSTGDYTDEEASELVDQRRYMEDFDWDRIVTVEAMKPWWGELMEEPYDDESEAKLEAVTEAGYRVWTVDDMFNLSEPDTKVIATGDGKRGDTQYHGTSSWHLARAFPGLELPPSPFPVEDLDLDDLDLRELKRKLLR